MRSLNCLSFLWLLLVFFFKWWIFVEFEFSGRRGNWVILSMLCFWKWKLLIVLYFKRKLVLICLCMVSLNEMIWLSILVRILKVLFLWVVVGCRVMGCVMLSCWLFLVMLVDFVWWLCFGYSMYSFWLSDWWRECLLGWWWYCNGVLFVMIRFVWLWYIKLFWLFVMKLLILKWLVLLLFRLMSWCFVRVCCFDKVNGKSILGG